MSSVMLRLAAARRAPRDLDSARGRAALRFLRWLGLVATVGMCLVLLQGTLVTNSGSAQGCGDTWPLCRGQVIPEFKGVEGAATLIEFTHRVAVPIESTLILLLTAGIVWMWPRRTETRILAPGMVFFLFLQAMLGGLAVMYPTSAAVLAAHFGISLLAFASVLLSTALVWEAAGGERVRDVPLAGGLRGLIWASFAYTYLVVYLGAYVRHVGAGLACLDWPLCNGALIPRFVTGVDAQFAHRLAALLLVLVLLWLFQAAWRVRVPRPDLYRAAAAAAILVLLQALSGAIVVYSRMAIPSTLLHSLLIALLFGTLSYLCLHTFPLTGTARVVEADRAGTPARGRTLQV